MFSRWTLFQGLIIVVLIALALLADQFKMNIAVPVSSPDVVNKPMILTAGFLIVLIGLFSLIMYFQTKKSDTFLQQRLWDKMYVIIPILLAILLIGFVILFLTGILNAVIDSNRWIIYSFIYATLFLINVTVLTIIHKIKKNLIPNETKIAYSFIWTSLSLFVIIFML